ncbi:MAG: hypothetical protein J5I94_29105 [Phaeodactylibacter sp.]|nr:hypothetical protein [Phaeodactylibacter sp.]
MKSKPIALLFPAAALAVATLAALHLISIVAATGTMLFLALISLTVSETIPNRQWLN